MPDLFLKMLIAKSNVIGHKDPERAQFIRLSKEAVTKPFFSNTSSIFKELLNKVVQVKGQVTGYDSLLIILNHKIVCQPHNTKIEKPKIGETVTMKGRCVSYDDLLEELRLDHVVQIIETTR